MADIDIGRKALDQVLVNWHAREPLRPQSVSDTGCFLDALGIGLLVFSALVSLMLGVAGWLEENGDHVSCTAAHVKGAQCAELQTGREGQDVGHGAHGAGHQGGGA